MDPKKLALALSLTSVLLAPGLCGQEIDLKRATPVPANEQIPISDFFRPAALQAPTLNPEGSRIAAIVTAGEDKHQLLVYGLATQKTEFQEFEGDSDITAAGWLTNDRVIMTVSLRKLYGAGIYASEVGALYNAYPLVQYYGSRVVGIPYKNRTRPLVWNRTGNPQAADPDGGVVALNSDLKSYNKGANLAKAGVSGAAEAMVLENNERHIETRYPLPSPGKGDGYMADKEGELGFAYTIQDGSETMFRYEGGKWLKCPLDIDNGVEIVGPGNVPGQLVAVPREKNGKPHSLQFLDSATGTWGDVLLQEKEYDFVGYVYRDPLSHEIIGAVSERAFPHVVWFTDIYKNLQKKLNALFPGQMVRILDSNEKQNVFLFSTFSDTQPPVYRWLNIETLAGGIIKESRPWIDTKRMVPMQARRFKTRDGHTLDCYLSLPAGTSKANPAPLVVLPHGGPRIKDNWGFDSEVQFLASRGYAVLQPNYRGSPGTNWSFTIDEEWDFRKMADDVTDSVKSILATGLVDPKRIAIMGGSFGGYQALSGVVNEPGLYRCAIAIAGVFDWAQLIDDAKSDYQHYNSQEYGYWLLHLGDPKNDPQKFDAIAPVRHLDRVKVPVFVSYGGYDPVVDIGQSKRLISELDRNHIPYDTYIASEESHGMKHLKPEVELYSKIEAFLAKNMAP